MCYHVCEWDTKLAFHLRLIMLERKMTILKAIQAVTEIFETDKSAKPTKTHGFIMGRRRQEQEM